MHMRKNPAQPRAGLLFYITNQPPRLKGYPAHKLSFWPGGIFMQDHQGKGGGASSLNKVDVSGNPSASRPFKRVSERFIIHLRPKFYVCVISHSTSSKNAALLLCLLLAFENDFLMADAISIFTAPPPKIPVSLSLFV